MRLRELWATRFALQRLTGTSASDPVAAVAESLAVQSQDVPLAHDSLAQRTGGDTAAAAAALDAGRIIRTHVLRPTWHHVAAEDVRWLLELTSPKVLSGLASRHRQLGLDDLAQRTRRLDALLAQVAQRPRTRAELARALTDAGVLDREHPDFWAQLSHLCLIAELEGLICSGPVEATGLNGHTYALAADVLPDTAPRSRAEAITELVSRFFASHGPVAVRDLQRWTRLTRAEVRAAVAELGDEVTVIHSPDAEADLYAGTRALDEHRPQERRAATAWLLSTFDEAVLTHTVAPLPLRRGTTATRAKYGESGGGHAIWDLHLVGAWKRTVTPGRFAVTLQPFGDLPASARRALASEADALARRSGHQQAELTSVEA